MNRVRSTCRPVKHPPLVGAGDPCIRVGWCTRWGMGPVAPLGEDTTSPTPHTNLACLYALHAKARKLEGPQASDDGATPFIRKSLAADHVDPETPTPTGRGWRDGMPRRAGGLVVLDLVAMIAVGCMILLWQCADSADSSLLALHPHHRAYGPRALCQWRLICRPNRGVSGGSCPPSPQPQREGGDDGYGACSAACCLPAQLAGRRGLGYRALVTSDQSPNPSSLCVYM